MSEWQPIETAPADGTEFLAYDPVVCKFCVCAREPDGVNIHGQIYMRIWPTQWDGTYGPLDGDFLTDRATHWTPLPSPPSTIE